MTFSGLSRVRSPQILSSVRKCTRPQNLSLPNLKNQPFWPNLKNQPFRALPAGLIKVLRVPGQISCLPVISSRSRRPSAFCKVCPFKNTRSLMHTEMQNRLRLKLQASKNVIFVKVSTKDASKCAKGCVNQSDQILYDH